MDITEIVASFKKLAQKNGVEKELLRYIGADNLKWYIETHQKSIHLDIDLSPELSYLMLKRNIDNREIEMGVVDIYNEDQRADDWLYTGECIKFDWNGILRDGQKRCTSNCSVGKSIPTHVVWGIAPDSFVVVGNPARVVRSRIPSETPSGRNNTDNDE